jgi:predicted YcjX-like family ATPase
LVITTVADTVLRQIETVNDTVRETLFEPTVRIGVTGLARAGKTVFLTSLVANLLDRGRMPHLRASVEGRIEAAYLQPQPDDTVPRFDFERHLGQLTSRTPSWPASTRAVSELRLSLRVRRAGLLAGLQGARVIHLDFVDYPGEWLLDLALLDKAYEAWSDEVIKRIKGRPEASGFIEILAATPGDEKHSEEKAQALAAAFTEYLNAARAAGYYDCNPGRFLLPGDLEGSPVLTFAPLPKGDAPRGSLRREMARRFEAYKAQVVKPFFRAHFSRIDRQVVLMDALGAIHSGPQAVEDMRRAMSDILSAFKPGRNAFLTQLFQGRRVEKILFAATKADHLHHTQHARLTAIMQAMLRGAADRARFAGAQTAAMAIASLRATTEDTVQHDGRRLDVVRGTLLEDGRQAAFHPGNLPEDPAQLLNESRDGAHVWLDESYRVMNFAPSRLDLRPGDGPPHIRLDKAAEFLLGDRL